MKIIELRRLDLNLSLAELSARTGIPKTVLWELERGCYLADPGHAVKLRETLGLPGLPDNSQLLSHRQRSRICPTRPVDWPRPSQTSWQSMERRFHYQLRRLAVPEAVLAWMKECLTSDSPYECLGLCGLAGDGATGMFENPHACGYRRQAILDRDGLALGERLLPGLRWRVDGEECLLWPQVTTLTSLGTFRLDLLMAMQGHWMSSELDGGTHLPERDDFRDQVLGIKPFRFKNEDVKNLRFVEMLKKQLRIALSLKAA